MEKTLEAARRWERPQAQTGAQSVQQTRDGGYIIAGYTGSYDGGGGDVYVLKTDAGGKEQWSRTYAGSATPN